MSRLLTLLVDMFMPMQIKQLSKFNSVKFAIYNSQLLWFVFLSKSKLPTHLKIYRYLNEDAHWHPSVAQIYVDSVPDFLRKKAPWFIRHCLAAMEKAGV